MTLLAESRPDDSVPQGAESSSFAELFAPGKRRLTLGILVAISIVGFENLGVATALPIVARALDGDNLYGWAFSAFLLGQLLGTVLAGTAADRIGPRQPMAVALVSFAAGLVVCSVATDMTTLVAGRALAGVGSGATLMLCFAVIGLEYPERIRTRMLTATQGAWIGPALVGPAISGPVAEHLSWRLVFGVFAPIVLVTAALLAPMLRRKTVAEVTEAKSLDETAGDVSGRDRFWSATNGERVIAAFVVTLGGAALVAGLDQPTLLRGVVVSALGVALIASVARSIFPAGTFRARSGMASIVLAYGLLIGGFVGIESFLPKALDDLRGTSAFVGGLFLSTGSVSWTLGAAYQSRNGEQWKRIGTRTAWAAPLTFGALFCGATIVGGAPIPISLVGWVVAGLGMGMTFNAVTESMYRSTPMERIGAATSATQLAASLLSAVAAGTNGAILNAADRSGWSIRSAFWLVFAFQAALAAVVLLAVSRVRADGDVGFRRGRRFVA